MEKIWLLFYLISEGLLFVDFATGCIYMRKSKNEIFYPATVYEKLNGYLEVKISYKGKRYYYFVHRVVMMAYLGKPIPDDLVVDHKDNNKKNNAINNLALVTSAENQRRKIEHMKQEGIKIKKLATNEQLITDKLAGLTTKEIMKKYGYISPSPIYIRLKKLLPAGALL